METIVLVPGEEGLQPMIDINNEDQLSDKQKLTEFYEVMFDGSKKNRDIYTQANTNSDLDPIELEPNTE